MIKDVKNNQSLADELGISAIKSQLTTLSDEIQNIKESTISSQEYKREIKELESKLQDMQKQVEEAQNIKNQIFGLMALFFGIFAFISIDVGITKGLISFFPDAENISNRYFFLICWIFSFALVQFIFFCMINKYLLKPFLKKE